MKKVLLIGTAVVAIGSAVALYVQREQLFDKWTEFASTWNEDLGEPYIS